MHPLDCPTLPWWWQSPQFGPKRWQSDSLAFKTVFLILSRGWMQDRLHSIPAGETSTSQRRPPPLAEPSTSSMEASRWSLSSQGKDPDTHVSSSCSSVFWLGRGRPSQLSNFSAGSVTALCQSRRPDCPPGFVAAPPAAVPIGAGCQLWAVHSGAGSPHLPGSHLPTTRGAALPPLPTSTAHPSLPLYLPGLHYPHSSPLTAPAPPAALALPQYPQSPCHQSGSQPSCPKTAGPAPHRPNLCRASTLLECYTTLGGIFSNIYRATY